ncbi:MAG: electron transfer flavoprotein subunit alpha/FixB family protein [Deltaproteobacteria bacterium]|jgi:electron transfer flavoprotein alpha subunit|nr:electron transfer flavoprotein subunit alpha/FixB family protein [Deltaproteobacteria bacterium]MBT4265892.1 electron transfer flavoprotein subunit alpha/FixB family protein [Deltaproteobacteria bacterium]MBT4643686.1 electron transfer flavoprotein subunit alpha/FixB family protein [Deltaproteobacteria bacterium]MBT6503277.1 electron transfer flavoprotein subunit alpha/FixB family protein [Deltaproteobacteria bacterium]MBT6614266.1 electron transfer flavoprotein subunit alpha/FixB family pro
MKDSIKEIWVFGDYRNYFQNRVTLQLLSRATELAKMLQAKVCAVVFGDQVDEWVNEYIAHGADRVLVIDHPDLKNYKIETYVNLMIRLIGKQRPEIILVGATNFGREFAPRIAKRLKTGLSADCVDLDINDEGLLVQTAPSFGGNILAQIITPECKPQMATVRPGTFQEIPHNYERTGEIVRIPMPADLPKERVHLIFSERSPQRSQRIEEAKVVICGGRGMGSKKKFKKLTELGELMNAEIGATRPVVYANWIEADALIGQAGKHIKPKVLFAFGISGAIQHTAAINNAEFIIAVNKNPNAPMMAMADIAIVADANQVCTAMIKELKVRIRG